MRCASLGLATLPQRWIPYRLRRTLANGRRRRWRIPRASPEVPAAWSPSTPPYPVGPVFGSPDFGEASLPTRRPGPPPPWVPSHGSAPPAPFPRPWRIAPVPVSPALFQPGASLGFPPFEALLLPAPRIQRPARGSLRSPRRWWPLDCRYPPVPFGTHETDPVSRPSRAAFPSWRSSCVPARRPFPSRGRVGAVAVASAGPAARSVKSRSEAPAGDACCASTDFSIVPPVQAEACSCGTAGKPSPPARMFRRGRGALLPWGSTRPTMRGAPFGARVSRGDWTS